MNPRQITGPLVREAPPLREDQSVEEAVRAIIDSGLPALPVLDSDGCLAGIFGEREFMTALFPGYVRELRFAGFVPKGLDEALEKRSGCRREPVRAYMTTDHVEAPSDASDVQMAEIFLHHRVLIVPVVDDKRVVGVITRRDFFRELGARFLASG
jgi:CBS domain-containing protein